MATSIVPTVTPSVATTLNGTSAPSVVANDSQTLAANFTAFLQLLTTQLRNQNPLDPLDTNQFTQQLVQFAQVEQQLKSNDQLATLVAIQKSAQATNAIGFVGAHVAVDGRTARLVNGAATWTFAVDKPASATVSITSPTGQVAYSGSYTINPGTQAFTWDGRDAAGTQWPDGNYTMTVTAKDANGQSVAVSTEVEGVVDSADLTQSPPLLSIGGQTFTLDQIKRIVRTAS
jgi:flagellar basal-body rod modification protein FlgD